MGKNHRHSKKLKSEKNKVHIKSKTKFLPKGQNVTNTSFKIKSIVIQEQLKEREPPSGNKKTANINELLPKLKHFNDTVKTESCQDLRDFITLNPLESVQIYLSSIIQNASALIQDRERKVRRASVKLLNAVFEKISDNTLRPFFTYVLTNLKCAMTNINKHVQEDSLLLLDAIIEHKSVLIAENFNDFFPNFLMLISKLKGLATSERSLSLNLEGKITSVKWRVKVLTRLYGVLHAMVQQSDENAPSNSSECIVSAKGAFYIPIYKDISVYESIDSVTFSQSKNVHTQFDDHILELTQLLYEIWMEIVPEKSLKKSSISTVMTSEDSVAVFTCVVHILRLLQKYVQNCGREDIFTQNKAVLFLDNIMSAFPYSHNKKNLEVAKEFPKCFIFNYDSNFVEENLNLIYIYITLRVKNGRNVPKQKSIATFLNNCLKTQLRLSSTSFACLVKILKEILLEHSFLCRRVGINEAELMKHISNFYNERIPEHFKNEILEILTSSRLQKHHLWMEKLPEFLCKDKIPGKLIDGILYLCRRGQEVVQNGVKNSLTRILGNLPLLEISDVSDVEVARKNLVSIIFYLPKLSTDDVNGVVKFVEDHPDLTYAMYLKNMLELRTYMSK